ncbi:MAG: hypothetical protein J6K82_00620 [Alphaproteobacteria bacterium]|nr:hypothetical protein [Alphaproteobacteria bacterium]
MKFANSLFSKSNQTRGSILVELLLSVALASVIIPFVFQYHQDSVTRAQNIAIANQMSDIQSALERYIVANREDLLRPVGRNITRVSVSDLAPFGVPESILDAGDDKYQLRILKSSDSVGGATLQGVIVRVSDDVSPMRTREIVNLSGGTMGFVDGTHAYGTFGAWHTDAVDLGVDIDNGIIETTSVNRDNALYLWRIPTQNADDAKMMSALNLAAHDIKNTKFLNAEFSDFSEILLAKEIVTNDLIFQNRTTIDQEYETINATVSGMLASDAKNMEVSGRISLSDVAKMSSLTTNNLWVSNMTLGGLSVDAPDDFALLRMNRSLDMTSGRIDAIYVTVGYTGSITPHLDVARRIEDSTNSEYYWDVSSKTANFSDASFVELGRMATLASIAEGDMSTSSGQIFAAVSSNKNATVADYMNAIHKIQERVRAKYRNLQLQ